MLGLEKKQISHMPLNKRIIFAETSMDEKDRETIKLVATILGNIAAISVGVALFENKPPAMLIGIFSGLVAFYTIRRLP